VTHFTDTPEQPRVAKVVFARMIEGRKTNSENRGIILDTVMTAGPALTAADRCDRCGAQAYVRVTLPTGGTLIFCAHHAKQHEDKLRLIAAEYVDETDRLNAIN